MAARHVNDKNEVQQGQGFYTGGEKGKSCPGCGQPLPGEPDPYKPDPYKPDPYKPDPYHPGDPGDNPYRRHGDPRKRPPPMIYMAEGTEGQTYPDERREEAQQATLANYYEKKKKNRGPQSGRIGNFGAGTQHPGHTGDSGLFEAYYQNVLGMNPDKKEQS